MQRTQSQRTLDDDLRPDFSAGRKLGEVEQALLWSLLHEEPECPSRVLLDKAAQKQIVIAVSLRQVNRWRAARGLNRRQGRPGHTDGSQPVSPGAEIIRVTPQMSFVGVHLFAQWLDHQEGSDRTRRATWRVFGLYIHHDSADAFCRHGQQSPC